MLQLFESYCKQYFFKKSMRRDLNFLKFQHFINFFVESKKVLQYISIHLAYINKW